MSKDTMVPRKKILFIIGSPNQASQMHQIASHLPDYDCFFSQLYSKHPIIKAAVRLGIVDTTILAGEFRRKGDAYLEKHGLRNDYAQGVYQNHYDLKVLCSDLLVTKAKQTGGGFNSSITRSLSIKFQKCKKNPNLISGSAN